MGFATQERESIFQKSSPIEGTDMEEKIQIFVLNIGREKITKRKIVFARQRF